MNTIIPPTPEGDEDVITNGRATDVVTNSQAESIFENWNLRYRLVAEFPIADIEYVESQQVRDTTNRARRGIVEQYYQQHENGAKFPPIVLRENGTLVDGNTRLAMWRKAGRDTVPAYLVSLPSTDMAKALGTQLNQLSGERLTPDEAARQAMDMLEQGTFDDAQIARMVGRSRQQVARWRQEQDFEARCEKADVLEAAKRVPDVQRRAISKVVQIKPFAELVNLASSRKVPNSDLTGVVTKVLAAESEEAAVQEIVNMAAELAPTGPDGRATAGNPKARRMRMVLPQVLNLAPAEQFFEPSKAESDREMWLQIKGAADEALAMYDRELSRMLA